MKDRLEIDLRARLRAEAKEIEDLGHVLSAYVDDMAESACRAAWRLESGEPIDSIGIRGMASDLGTMTARLQRRLNRFDYLSTLACEMSVPEEGGPLPTVPAP